MVTDSKEVDKRLATIEGHIKGQGHLSSCVAAGFKEGRMDDMITELSDLFELSRR